MTPRFLNFGLSLGIVALLAACGGDADETNPVSGGPGAAPAEEPELDDEEANVEDVISENLSEDLVAAVYDPNSETLSLNLTGLDSGTVDGNYERNPSLDTNGYIGFSTQSDPLDRLFIALAGISADQSIEAVVVADGGQFNRFFGGGYFRGPQSVEVQEPAEEGADIAGGDPIFTTVAFVKPTTGLVSYAGDYAAVTNVPARGDNLLERPDGFEAETLVPRQPARVVGDIFINVDFADSSINGEIFNREWVDHFNVADGAEIVNGVPVDQSNLPRLPDVVLTQSPIAENGRFLGETEFPDQTTSGDFGGTFGGIGSNSATSLAGVVHLNDFSDDIDNEEEFGVFVLEQCGTAAASPVCNGTGD